VRNLFLTGELLNVLSLFGAHGIPAVTFKGPALAASVYGHIGLREFSDIDLLVHKQDARKAQELLVTHGYKRQPALTAAQQAFFLRFSCECVFSGCSGRSFIDLHWGISSEYFPVPFDAEPLWTRLKPVTLASSRVWTFSPEDLLLFLCVHGAKHLWEQLEWICGVAELINTSGGELDWGQVNTRAKELRCERILLLGLALASDILGAGLPGHVSNRIRADRAIRALIRRVRERLFRVPARPPGTLENSLFRLKAMDSLPDAVKGTLRCAFVPDLADWASLELPASLYPFYYVIRPIRLLAKYWLYPFSASKSTP
jgi:hypothetical protein